MLKNSTAQPLPKTMGTQKAPGARGTVALGDLPAVATALAGVKPFPAVVQLVRKLAADPKCAASDVARLVEGDVGLVTDILRVVNAPASGLRQRCTGVRHAVTLLGLKRVSEVVAGAAALSYVEKAMVPHPALAAHAIAVAGVARMLAPIIGISPDEAFTIALLHDVGAMLIVQSDDPFYERLLEQTALGEEPSVEDEEAIMGFDHGALGGEVLRRWHFPAPGPQVLELHHRWEDALAVGGSVCAMVALIRASEKLVAATGVLVEPRLADLDSLFGEPAFAYLGLSREELLNLWPALLRTSDKAFVVGGGTDEAEPPSAGAAQPPPSLATYAASPPADSKLGVWAVAFVVIVAALVGIIACSR